MKLENVMHIGAPVEVVWALTEDVEAWPDVTPTMTSVERLEDGPLAVGSQASIKRPGQGARVWTVTATAEMAGLNVITYLTAYLDVCGRIGGKPPTGPDLQRFLPWTATREDLDTWAQPPRPG